jgi:hypothetical protein
MNGVTTKGGMPSPRDMSEDLLENEQRSCAPRDVFIPGHYYFTAHPL